MHDSPEQLPTAAPTAILPDDSPEGMAGFLEFLAWVADYHADQSTDEQLGKVVEEIGEVFRAWNGSPRRGIGRDPAATAGELADVMLAAGVALNHLHRREGAPNPAEVMAAVARKVTTRLTSRHSGESKEV